MKKIILTMLGILFLTGMPADAYQIQQREILAIPRNRPAELPPFRGKLLLFPLDDRHVVAAGNYDEFLSRRILAEYGKRLEKADFHFSTKKLPEWSYRFFYNYSAAEILADYLPVMRNNFQNPAYFKLTVNDGATAPERLGFWLNAVGMKRLPCPGKAGTELLNSAELVPFAYFRLPVPLKNQDRLRIATIDGDAAELMFHDETVISRAIKVNQEGYLPDAGEKYAYLGMWLGDLGPLPVEERIGKPFHLRRAADGSIAYSGTLRLRSPEQYITKDKQEIPLNGETVLDMDFSEFSAPGRYFIQVPGVGRSWEFVIGDDAIGHPFYVQMRGLYHQRSGIAKTAPHTRWTIGADHMQTYRGGFAPNDGHYRGKGCRITDAEGKRVELAHFRMIEATATEELMPEVRGGWWDAGDFDRRTYHFAAVDALLSVYLLFPENFSDNQLDLPESGNGIADIIDEAAWGVEVWRLAQRADGGVGCWIEATSHPKNPDPVTDTQRYYAALPTRESSLLYSIYAAKLARAYRANNRPEEAKRFYDSALKAWRFAENPANQAKITFPYFKRKLTYTEPEKLSPELRFKAALNFYLYNREPEFKTIVEEADFKAILNRCRDAQPAYFLSELAEDDESFFLLSSQFRKMICKRADELIRTQQDLAYRNVHWMRNSVWFSSMAWGESLPFKKGAFLVMAYQVSGNRKYRDAALLQADWMYGANPMGRSMTTGLGKVYPIRLLSLPLQAYRDRWVDPFPGITPFTFTGVNDYSAARLIYRYEFKPRKDHNFNGCSVTLLPDSLGGTAAISQRECWQLLNRTVPMWRRFANVEGEAVDQNEFTIWETMAPAAAACGALLPKGWKPPVDWKDREPVKTLDELPGYIFLP